MHNLVLNKILWKCRKLQTLNHLRNPQSVHVGNLNRYHIQICHPVNNCLCCRGTKAIYLLEETV